MKNTKLLRTLICGALAILMMLVALTGCELLPFGPKPDDSNDGGNEPAAKTLVSITLESMPTKLDYEIGETVDTAGMKVIANFSDGTKEDVTDKCTTTIGSDKITATTGVCVLNRVRLFEIPMDCSPPGSSVGENFQARILEQVAISSSRGSSQPRDRTRVSCVSCIGRQICYH